MADLNPAKAWNGLSKNGKIAVVAGVLAISIYMWYREKQKSAAAAASAQSASGSDTSNTAGDNSGIDPTTGIPYSEEQGSSGYYDSSIDPTTGVPYAEEYAMSAYGGDAGLGASYGAPTSGTDTTTGAGSTNSNGTDSTSPNITINVPPSSSGPSTTTGGGAPSTPSPTAAHSAPAPALSQGAIDTTNAAGKPAPKAGYTLVGTGNGNYQYVPNSKAKKGYKIYGSISHTKPQANAIGLGNGLWEVPA